MGWIVKDSAHFLLCGDFRFEPFPPAYCQTPVDPIALIRAPNRLFHPILALRRRIANPDAVESVDGAMCTIM